MRLTHAVWLATLSFMGLFATEVAAQPGPLAQQAFLKATNAEAADQFGRSVAVSGNTLVVGALDEDSWTTGVDGDQVNNLADGAGAVYVFTRASAADAWSADAYLKASNTDAGDGFGGAIAIDGDTIVVGADGEQSNATGVNGNEANNSWGGAGAVYVFVRDSQTGTWSQQAYLKASNTDVGDHFGTSVAMSGDTLVVGALEEASSATGVNGSQSDDSLFQAGAAYVFVRDPQLGTWSQEAYLKASNAGARDMFGQHVGVSGDTAVVAARFEESAATGVNGDSSDNSAPSSGAAYVFVRDPQADTWSQQAYLKASNTDLGDLFAASLSVDGDTLVVGAVGESSAATGVNGDETNDSSPFSGAAYVFDRDAQAGTWSQIAYLKPLIGDAFDSFGVSVSLSGDRLVVGTVSESSSATGIDGDASDNSAGGSGAAYLFERDTQTGTWSQQAYLKASTTDASDRFGFALSLSGDVLAIGAFGEDSASAAVNGNQENDAAAEAGASYAFQLGVEPSPWTNQSCALDGLVGPPWLEGSGPLSDGSDNLAALIDARSSSAAALFIALNSTPAAFKGGTLKPVPWFKVLFTNTSGAGGFAIPFVMPPAVPAGTELWLQWAIQDAAATSGVALSNAVRGVTP